MSDIYIYNIYVYRVILVQLQRFMNEISSNEFFRCFSQAPPNAFLSSSSNSSPSSSSCGPPLLGN